MKLKELLGYLCCGCKVDIFDCNLADDDWWEDDNNTTPHVFHGDYTEVPDYLYDREVYCFTVSDEYVGCLDIDLGGVVPDYDFEKKCRL